jgi:hypothetical protein
MIASARVSNFPLRRDCDRSQAHEMPGGGASILGGRGRDQFVGVRGLDTPTAWQQSYWPRACVSCLG